MIPGQIVSLLSFMGVIVHEWAHQIACRVFGVRVLSVKYFSLSGGHVIHDKVSQPLASICIALAPLVVNTTVAIICGCILAAMSYWQIDSAPLKILIIYLGITIGMHAFPSKQDIANFADLVAELKRKNLYRLAKFIGGFFAILRVLSYFWVDVWIAIMLMVLPMAVLEHISPQYRARFAVDRNARNVQENIRDLKNIIRAEYSTGDFEFVSLYSRDSASGNEQEILNPYGGGYVALHDNENLEYFFVITTDVPPADCEAILERNWRDAVAAFSPSNCADAENAILVKYHK